MSFMELMDKQMCPIGRTWQMNSLDILRIYLNMLKYTLIR
jgi:hypothetical protein